MNLISFVIFLPVDILNAFGVNVEDIQLLSDHDFNCFVSVCELYCQTDMDPERARVREATSGTR